jgi:hypothetical protein
VEKSEYNNFQYGRRKTPIFLRPICFSSSSMNPSHVPWVKKKKKPACEDQFFFFFQLGCLVQVLW